jgi:DNA-binding transcriptional LysR family regulator
MEQNISLYKIFNTVASTGNISKAAKELFISQPAISKSIGRLEDDLGITLFVRTSRGVRLTVEGNMLYEYTRSAFETLQQGEETIRRINELGIGHLRIGVSTTLCKYILLPYLKEFVQQYPHIKITIHSQSTFHTLEMLENNKLDIGLVGKPNSLKTLEFYKVAMIEDIFVSSETYLENLRVREISHSKNELQIDSNHYSPMNNIDIIKTANVMLLDEKNMTRLYIDDYFTRNNIVTKQILEVSDMDLLIEFAKIGLGVSCVIKEFIQTELNEGTLREIPLEKPLGQREVGFAYSVVSPKPDSLQKFIDFIVAHSFI